MFNTFKRLKSTAKGERKKFLKNIGEVGYKKIVMDMLNQGKVPDPTTDLGWATQQILQDVVDLFVNKLTICRFPWLQSTMSS